MDITAEKIDATIRVWWPFDHRLYTFIGCSDKNAACACDSRLCPVGPSPPIDDNTCRYDTHAHALHSFVSMVWATPTNNVYRDIG